MLRSVRFASLVCTSVLLIAGTAHANCPDKRASCVLHEEGVDLLMAKNYEEAAKKFAAAIAAEPTARSYLGYAQAVESLGQIALAYDTMVAAQRLSAAEVQASPKDTDVTGRAERIKYKLGELRAKIGFVWLRVPDGVRPQRVVAVRREGEGDLSQPLTQWTAVAPTRQILIATIDDGSKLEVVAEVAAGSQGVVIIPISRTVAPPNVGPVPGMGRPLTQLYMPMIRPPHPTYSAYFAIGLSILEGGPSRADNKPTSGGASGLTLLYDRKLLSSIGLTARVEYEFHTARQSTDFTTSNTLSIGGHEAVLIAGLRTMGSPTIHGRVGVGVSVYSESVEQITGIPMQSGFTRAYPTFEIGGGLHLGRVRLQMGILASAGAGDPTIPNLGTRFMGTFAIDLYRKTEPLPPPPAGPSAPPPPLPGR